MRDRFRQVEVAGVFVVAVVEGYEVRACLLDGFVDFCALVFAIRVGRGGRK